MNNHTNLRRNMRARRRALSEHERRAHSLDMAALLVKSPLFLRSRRIAAYISADAEIDPSPVISAAQAMGKACFFPVLRAHPQRTMWFCEYREGDPLVANQFGILEPSVRRRSPVPPWGLDLILLPLVAFDVNGNRLGMGGGYYDRTLAFLRRRRCWHSPSLIGLAHEIQKVDAIQVQEWDIPLQGVVTEAVFYRWK